MNHSLIRQCSSLLQQLPPTVFFAFVEDFRECTFSKPCSLAKFCLMISTKFFFFALQRADRSSPLSISSPADMGSFSSCLCLGPSVMLISLQPILLVVLASKKASACVS
ncbi:hypothetical protein Ancab_010334 [Ancistrocladus abbreviatus]